MEAYRFDDGMITVACCDESLSIGTLTLHGHTALDPHDRPVDEELLQVEGTGALRLFDDDGNEERQVTLEDGDTFRIPSKKQHAHVNPGDGGMTVLWKFRGDIRDIIADIRDDHEHVD